MAPKTVERVTRGQAPRRGSLPWRVYWEMVEARQDRISRAELTERLGGTRQRAHPGLVQLQHLELLVWDASAMVFRVRAPRSAEASEWLLGPTQRPVRQRRDRG